MIITLLRAPTDGDTQTGVVVLSDTQTTYKS